MSGGKTSQDQTKVKLDPAIKEQALKNLELAQQVGNLPYAPNFGLQYAAFTPQQENAFANTNAAAGAFGLPSGGGTGMPTPQNVGGFRGYSTQPLYEQSMGQVDPKILALYNSFFYPQSGGGRGGAGGGGAGGGRDTRSNTGGGVQTIMRNGQRMIVENGRIVGPWRPPSYRR